MRTAPLSCAKNPVLLMVGEGGLGGVSDYVRGGYPTPLRVRCDSAAPQARQKLKSSPGRFPG